MLFYRGSCDLCVRGYGLDPLVKSISRDCPNAA